MGKFNKSGKKGMPELNTSSLPDLIFTMLFFFMIVTTMREVSLKVQFKVPQATELEKLGRSPEGGHGNPFQYCLENPMDRGGWLSAHDS